MPRKNPLPLREKEIGHRCRAARKGAGFSQVEMAKRAGIDSNRLASYEHGRNPIPYQIGDAIARETGFNQRWLATGKEPMTPYLAVDEVVARVVPESAAFSLVFDTLLRGEIETRLKNFAKTKGHLAEASVAEFLGFTPLWSGRAASQRQRCRLQAVAVATLSALLPYERLNAFIDALDDVLSDFQNFETKAVKDEDEVHRKVIEHDLREIWRQITRKVSKS